MFSSIAKTRTFDYCNFRLKVDKFQINALQKKDSDMVTKNYYFLLLISISTQLSSMNPDPKIEKGEEQHEKAFELNERLYKLAWPYAPHNLEKIEKLLEAGANPNIIIDQSWEESLLHKACQNDDCNPLVVLLLKYKANRGIESSRKLTPLHFAAIGGAVKNTIDLLQAKAFVNARDSESNTPLNTLAKQINYAKPEYQYYKKYLVVGKILIEAGADFKRADRYGQTPIDIFSSECLAHYPHFHEFLALFEKK